MVSFFLQQWFLTGLGGAAVLGYCLPETGLFLVQHNVLDYGLIASFFLTGLFLESGIIRKGLKAAGALLTAIVLSLVIYPLVAWLVARLTGSTELVIGCCIIAAGPVTVSSGTILTVLARGNAVLSVLICVFTHLIAIFSMPFVLGLLLGGEAGIDLPVLKILFGLVLKALLPLVFGQVVRPLARSLLGRYGPASSVFQSMMILLMVIAAVSGSAERLHKMDGLLLVLTVVLGLHICMLLISYGIARILAFDRDTLVAFVIHAPQKSLGVSYIVWAGFFAADFPGAFVPAIACHLSQMVTGTLLAERFKRW